MPASARNESPPPPIRCPRCNNWDVVSSLPRNLWDEIMRGFGRVPKHCRYCGKRFYHFDRVSAPEGE